MRYLFFLFFLQSCEPTPPQCQDFKTGRFVFETKINGQLETTTFHRYDAIEISTFHNVIDTSRVQWVSNCEYTLRKINPKTIDDQKALYFKIIATNKNYYTFEYSIVGDLRNKQRGIAKRLRNADN